MQCKICNETFNLVSRNIKSKISMNGKIKEARISCPKCLETFTYVGDPTDEQEEEGWLANPRSTIKAPVPGKRSFPKTLKALPKSALSSDWFDYCGPHLENLYREVEYFETISKERFLTKEEFNEYMNWREMYNAALDKKKEAEARLRERGEIDDDL